MTPQDTCRCAKTVGDVLTGRIKVLVECRVCGRLGAGWLLQVGTVTEGRVQFEWAVSRVWRSGVMVYRSLVCPLIDWSFNNPPHCSSYAPPARDLPILSPWIIDVPASLETNIWTAKSITQVKFEIWVAILEYWVEALLWNLEQEAGVLVATEKVWMGGLHAFIIPSVRLWAALLVCLSGQSLTVFWICCQWIQGGRVTEELNSEEKEGKKSNLIS